MPALGNDIGYKYVGVIDTESTGIWLVFVDGFCTGNGGSATSVSTGELHHEGDIDTESSDNWLV